MFLVSDGDMADTRPNYADNMVEKYKKFENKEGFFFKLYVHLDEHVCALRYDFYIEKICYKSLLCT